MEDTNEKDGDLLGKKRKSETGNQINDIQINNNTNENNIINSDAQKDKDLISKQDKLPLGKESEDICDKCNLKKKVLTIIDIENMLSYLKQKNMDKPDINEILEKNKNVKFNKNKKICDECLNVLVNDITTFEKYIKDSSNENDKVKEENKINNNEANNIANDDDENNNIFNILDEHEKDNTNQPENINKLNDNNNTNNNLNIKKEVEENKNNENTIKEHKDEEKTKSKSKSE